MGELISDPFQRPDQAGSWGNAWATIIGSPALAITSNEGTMQIADFASAYMMLGSGEATDQEDQVRVSIGDTSSGAALLLRFSYLDFNLNTYRLSVTSGFIQLDKIVNWTRTQLSDIIPLSLGTGFVQTRFQVIGNVLKGKAWKDGDTEPDWQVSLSDADLASGWVGVYGSPSPTATLKFDHFTADDTQVPPPQVVPTIVIPATLNNKTIPAALNNQVIPATIDNRIIPAKVE